jgi:hypothetical protein
MELVRDVVLVVLPAFLSVLAGKLLRDKAEAERLRKIVAFAEEAVLFVEDAFPDSPGVEKLKKAIEYLKGVLARAGVTVSDTEAEAKVRAAYQRLQREALDRLVEKLLG